MGNPPGKYRIAEEDVIHDPERLLLDAELQAEWPKNKKDKGYFPWVRTAAYKQGHLLSPDGATAYCGRPIYPPADFLWDAIREIAAAGGKDPGEYWVARDRRKGEKCKTCKPASGRPAGWATWEENDLAQDMGRALSDPERPETRPLHSLTPTERMTRQRLTTVAARLVTQLGGATIEK